MSAGETKARSIERCSPDRLVAGIERRAVVIFQQVLDTSCIGIHPGATAFNFVNSGGDHELDMSPLRPSFVPFVVQAKVRLKYSLDIS